MCATQYVLNDAVWYWLQIKLPLAPQSNPEPIAEMSNQCA